LIFLGKAWHALFIATEIRRPVSLLQAVLHQHLESIIKMTSTKSKAKQKVAIVGSGMAGLVTAYLLHHDLHQRYSVTVFESVRIRRMPPVLWSDKLPLG
jgi:NADPH-dependent 2,4-dienoyl-CoA reductase/sulfur reductase-like enzyme